MIRKPNNWETVQEFSDRPKLPLGAYVCKVKKAVIQQNTGYGDQLCILFDIEDGEHAGFYGREFNSNTNENRKWKGVLRLWLPVDDGSDKDEITKRIFKGMVTSFEKSNPGYKWNWDETTLSGKLVGIMFRNEEWEYNNKTGWTVRPFRAISVESVENGDYTLPNDKPLKNKSAIHTAKSSDFAELEDDDELPF